jgi:hypothetical protein
VRNSHAVTGNDGHVNMHAVTGNDGHVNMHALTGNDGHVMLPSFSQVLQLRKWIKYCIV